MSQAPSSLYPHKVSITPLSPDTCVAGSTGTGGESQGWALWGAQQGPATFGRANPGHPWHCPCCGCLVPLSYWMSERETCPSCPLLGVGALLLKLESYIVLLVETEDRVLRG